MSAELVEGLMAYEARVRGYLDWRTWSDCLGVQVGDRSRGIVALCGTAGTHGSLRRLFAGVRYQEARLESPIFLTSLYSAR